jgi:hypothetical protein
MINGHELLDEIVRRKLHHRVERVGGRREQNGVTVRRRGLHGSGGKLAASARSRFDHDRLPPGLLQMLGDDA